MDSTNGDTENANKSGKQQLSTSGYHLKTFLFSLNLLAHLLAAGVSFINFVFVTSNHLPNNYATNLHVLLCVAGYQLLMAESLLCLSPYNGWSLHLKLVDKRRAHWILQIGGSVLAFAGNFIKILDKEINWNTLHGQFALVSMVFTVASFLNGITSLYAYELRRFLPPKLSKLTHICFGIVAFASSCISLIYGVHKGFFRNWSGDAMADATIAMIVVLTVITCIQPCITFVQKLKSN